MLQAVSFGGTFKVSNQQPNSPDDFVKFHNYAEKISEKMGVCSFSQNTIKSMYPYSYCVEQTLIIPDAMDNSVESFCARNGIKFKKFETSDLLDPATIKSRVQDAPQDFVKVEVDVDKLSKLMKTQDGNIEHCRKDYEDYFKNHIDFTIRSGEKFPATTLFISTSNTNALVNYIDRYGADNLNNNQVSLDFSGRTLGQDQCVYFALKNLGLKKVPVYVDAQTYLIGNKLGLFK